MSANFLLAGIVAGLVSGLGLNGTFDAFAEHFIWRNDCWI